MNKPEKVSKQNSLPPAILNARNTVIKRSYQLITL